MSAHIDVLIPTHAHPLLLPFAVSSAQAQSTSGVRIVIIGDGVGDETRDVVSPMLRDDPDLVFLDLPKVGRTGERHRHRVLAQTDAHLVTYLSDDDLLFPDHVVRMAALLQHVDVAMPMANHLLQNREVEISPWSLGEDPGRSMALGGASMFSLTGLSHTVQAYRKLPFGWRDTPRGFATDQYMLLQFMAQDWCRLQVDDTVTTVHLADSIRRDMNPQQRFEELRDASAWMRDGDGWAEFRNLAHRYVRRQAAHHVATLHAVRDAHDAEKQLEATQLLATLEQLRGLEDRVMQAEEALATSLGQRTELQANMETTLSKVADLESKVMEADAAKASAIERNAVMETKLQATLTLLEREAERIAQLERTLVERTAELAAVMATRTIRLRNSLVKRRSVRALLQWRRGG